MNRKSFLASLLTLPFVVKKILSDEGKKKVHRVVYDAKPNLVKEFDTITWVGSENTPVKSSWSKDGDTVTIHYRAHISGQINS